MRRSRKLRWLARTFFGVAGGELLPWLANQSRHHPCLHFDLRFDLHIAIFNIISMSWIFFSQEHNVDKILLLKSNDQRPREISRNKLYIQNLEELDIYALG